MIKIPQVFPTAGAWPQPARKVPGRAPVDSMIAQPRAGEPHNRSAHTLKGTSLNLGAMALGQPTKELQHAPAAAVL